MKATIYEQRTPVMAVGIIGHKSGDQKDVFAPNVVMIGTAEGSYLEVWTKAKKMTKAPIIEWEDTRFMEREYK